MKSRLILLSLFSVCLGNLYGQGNSETSDHYGENLVDIPVWIGDNAEETIRKIEELDTIGYSEYIQLAVSYSEINAKELKVGHLVEASMKLNTKESCDTFSFMLENRKDWKIVENYSDLVREKLQMFNCNN